MRCKNPPTSLQLPLLLTHPPQLLPLTSLKMLEAMFTQFLPIPLSFLRENPDLSQLTSTHPHWSLEASSLHLWPSLPRTREPISSRNTSRTSGLQKLSSDSSRALNSPFRPHSDRDKASPIRALANRRGQSEETLLRELVLALLLCQLSPPPDLHHPRLQLPLLKDREKLPQSFHLDSPLPPCLMDRTLSTRDVSPLPAAVARLPTPDLEARPPEIFPEHPRLVSDLPTCQALALKMTCQPVISLDLVA